MDFLFLVMTRISDVGWFVALEMILHVFVNSIFCVLSASSTSASSMSLSTRGMTAE